MACFYPSPAWTGLLSGRALPCFASARPEPVHAPLTSCLPEHGSGAHLLPPLSLAAILRPLPPDTHVLPPNSGSGAYANSQSLCGAHQLGCSGVIPVPTHVEAPCCCQQSPATALPGNPRTGSRGQWLGVLGAFCSFLVAHASVPEHWLLSLATVGSSWGPVRGHHFLQGSLRGRLTQLADTNCGTCCFALLVRAKMSWEPRCLGCCLLLMLLL